MQKKKCTICKINKRIGYFRKASKNEDGLDTRCRSCRVKTDREARAREAIKTRMIISKHKNQLKPLQKQERALGEAVDKAQKAKQSEEVIKLKAKYKNVVGQIQDIFTSAEKDYAIQT